MRSASCVAQTSGGPGSTSWSSGYGEGCRESDLVEFTKCGVPVMDRNDGRAKLLTIESDWRAVGEIASGGHRVVERAVVDEVRIGRSPVPARPGTSPGCVKRMPSRRSQAPRAVVLPREPSGRAWAFQSSAETAGTGPRRRVRRTTITGLGADGASATAVRGAPASRGAGLRWGPGWECSAAWTRARGTAPGPPRRPSRGTGGVAGQLLSVMLCTGLSYARRRGGCGHIAPD